jgi:hypothetical protein
LGYFNLQHNLNLKNDFFISTIVTMLLLSFLPSPTPGGTTETAMRNTFGLETTRTEFTLVSAELTEFVLIITRSAIVMRLFPRNYSMMVSCIKIIRN